MSKAPCKGCEKRHPGCHDKCDDYQEFAEERKQIRERRNQLNNVHYMDKELKQKCNDIRRKRKYGK